MHLVCGWGYQRIPAFEWGLPARFLATCAAQHRTKLMAPVLKAVMQPAQLMCASAGIAVQYFSDCDEGKAPPVPSHKVCPPDHRCWQMMCWALPPPPKGNPAVTGAIEGAGNVLLARRPRYAMISGLSQMVHVLKNVQNSLFCENQLGVIPKAPGSVVCMRPKSPWAPLV